MVSRLLHNGDTVGLIACSDGRTDEREVARLGAALREMGLRVRQATTLFRRNGTPFSGSAKERAQALTGLFLDDQVRMICDVSGGDSANQILPYLDFGVIRQNPKPFMGNSDLTVILNALYARAQLPTFHYHIGALVGAVADEQRRLFRRLFMGVKTEDNEFLSFDYTWLRGAGMTGTVIGGNIRCFLKLAGTPYLPDPADKVLFLESLGGGVSRTSSLLAQLRQMGYLERCKGILLGTFTAMQTHQHAPTIEELVLDITQGFKSPIAVTEYLGHGADAHCLPIGTKMVF